MGSEGVANQLLAICEPVHCRDLCLLRGRRIGNGLFGVAAQRLAKLRTLVCAVSPLFFWGLV